MKKWKFHVGFLLVGYDFLTQRLLCTIWLYHYLFLYLYSTTWFIYFRTVDSWKDRKWPKPLQYHCAITLSRPERTAEEDKVSQAGPSFVLSLLQTRLIFIDCCIDPPGHGRIGGHYFHTWCPYVRPSVTKTKNATT